jgi:hypothetical protein
LQADGVPAEGPATGKRAWSVKKCCLHYALAITGLADSRVATQGLIIDYDLLGAPETSRAIARYLGIELTESIPFAPKPKPSVDPDLQAEIFELTGDARRVYQCLRERSLSALENT